jgi:hypothetical protein
MRYEDIVHAGCTCITFCWLTLKKSFFFQVRDAKSRFLCAIGSPWHPPTAFGVNDIITFPSTHIQRRREADGIPRLQCGSWSRVRFTSSLCRLVNLVILHRHINEHLDGMASINASQMTQEELEFHYFKYVKNWCFISCTFLPQIQIARLW